MHKILVVNPGSTTTKIALFTDETQVSSDVFRHDAAALQSCGRLWNQLDLRWRVVHSWTSQHVQEVSAVAAIGGLLRPLEGGTYTVNERMLADARHNLQGEHASNLGCALARRLAAAYGCPAYVVDPVSVDAEHPLFLMYTSGSTGKPKGCQHRTGGYLAYVTGTSKYIQDIHPEDVYWCMADIGWITGHSYIVYGPLALASSSVIYEGVPTYPDPGRVWRIAERLGVNIFHTSPTAIRMLRKAGHDEPLKYNYHFKHMTTVGEPIEPEVWRWYYDTVGKREAVIVDTWWQTETGGFLCSTKPALDPMKPGSAGPGMPGIYPGILDEMGEVLPLGSGKAGNIVIRNPWPGIMQTIWGDRERFVNQYYRKYCKNPQSKDWHDWPYFAADGAVLAVDGYFRILGRVDDVINVAGHRLGTKEIESACLTVEEVAEAAVVPVVDEVKGRVPEVYVSLKPGIQPSKEIVDKVNRAIETIIGKIARPKHIHIVPDMPKTRSGKLMRRILAAISNRGATGDITTLANPDVVEKVREMVQGKEPIAVGEVADDIKQFGKED